MSDRRPVFVLAVDEAGTVRFASGAVRAFFGASPPDLRGLAIDRLWSDRPPLLENVRRAQTGSPSRDVVLVGDTWLELHFDPLLGERDEPSGCLVVAVRQPRGMGIADLIREDGRIEMLLRHVRGAVWATDRMLRIVYAVGSLKRELRPGVDDSPIGLTVAEFARQAGADQQIVAHHQAALAGHRTDFRYVFRGHTYDIGLDPLRDGQGTIVGCVAVALDVTERDHVLASLRLSEARLESAQRAAHVGSWEWDIPGDRVTWTDEFRVIYDLPPGKFSGTFQDILSRVHPEDAEPTRRTVMESVQEGKPLRFSHRIIRPDGSVRMLHGRGDVERDGRGQVVRLSGSCWDISQIWEKQEALERALSLHRAILESTADGILVVDRAGQVATFNQRFLSLWHLPSELAERRDDTALLRLATGQLDQPQTFRHRVDELYAEPEAEALDVLHFKDGRIFERYSRPQRLGKDIVGRVWSFRDVTERERLIQGVTLLADASRLLASLDIEPALEATAHLTIPLLGDACALDLYKPPEGPRRLFSLALDPAHTIPAEMPAIRNGAPAIYSYNQCSCLGVPLKMRGEVIGALTFMTGKAERYGQHELRLTEDLARRMEMALANARLYREAREALKAREEFLSIAAHELRGPVAALRLAVQGIQRAPPGSEAVPKALEVIAREERRIARFVDDLLDVSRARAGQLDFTLEPVDLAGVTRDVVNRLAPDIARAGSTVALQAESPVTGIWDRSRVDQIVWNLISNALKYGRGKPIAVTVTATDQAARLTVKDQGIGIPIDQQQRIFDPFERGVSGRHYGGLGLGLYIVRSIVERLGGKLHLESAPGAGSTFLVDLPRARPA